MESKFKYKRMFLILNPEDKGFGVEKEPSGYVKIEVKDKAGSINAMVQNLRENDKYIYKMYLVSRSMVEPVLIGPIGLKGNKGEIKWNFNPYDVGCSGMSIDEFTIAVVLAENKDSRINQIICPLAAYKDGKTEWRGRLLSYLTQRVNEAVYEEIKEEDVSSRYKVELESKFSPDVNSTAPSWPSEDSAGLYETGKELSELGEVGNDYQNGDDKVSKFRDDDRVEKETSDFFEAQTQDILNSVYLNETPIPTEESIVEGIQTPYETNNNYTQNRIENTFDSYERLNTGNCLPGSSSFCPANAIGGNYNPCAGCMLKKNTPATGELEKESASKNVPDIKGLFEQYFEAAEPFKSKRKDYQWWKVNSPVHLNNILYRYHVKTPVLFNPKVLMAHFKYRHLMVGMYRDMVNKMEYIVFGVPAVYSVDEKPFGEICRWAQVEGNRPSYGAFGYWLVYIDSKSGKLLGADS